MILEIEDKKIATLGIKSIIDFYKTISIDQLQTSGIDAFLTGINSSSLNVVIDTRNEYEFNFETLDILKNFFQKYHVPWCWFLPKRNDTLKKYNFDFLYESPGMYFDLEESLIETESDFIHMNEEIDDLKKWIQPLQEGFPSDDNCEGYRKLNADLISRKENKLRHFTAYYNDEPAASGTLFLSDQSVMLHNLATKNKYRNRRIGSALTLHMMSQAKKMGYRHCFLDSSEEGFNLYSRLGFKVYCLTFAYEKNLSV